MDDELESSWSLAVQALDGYTLYTGPEIAGLSDPGAEAEQELSNLEENLEAGT